MTQTKAQINWTNCIFNLVSIKRVTNCMFGQGGAVIKFKGDIDVFPSVVAAVDINPTASVTTGDPATMMGFSPGTDSLLTATMKDAKNQTGGDIIFTMTPCVFENADTTGAHAAFGTVTGTFSGYAPDGLTPPLSFARA